MKTFLPSPRVYVVQLSSGRSEKTSSVTPLFFLTHGVITLRRNGLASFRNFSRFVISIFHFKFNLSSKPGSSDGAGSGYPSPPRPPLFVVQKRALRTSPQTPPLVSPMSSAFWGGDATPPLVPRRIAGKLCPTFFGTCVMKSRQILICPANPSICTLGLRCERRRSPQ